MSSLRKMITLSSKYLPSQFPRLAFYFTQIVAFILLALVGKSFAEFTFPIDQRSPFLTTLTNILDPLIIHLLTWLLVVRLNWSYQKNVSPNDEDDRVVRIILGVIMPVVLLTLSYVVEQILLKPAFKYLRPNLVTNPLGDPWLTNQTRIILSKVVELLGAEPSQYQDVPSGFVMRQILLFYFIAWTVSQPVDISLGKISSQIVKWGSVTIGLASVGWVAFSRIYRANHSLLGVSIAYATATFLFWSFLGVLYGVNQSTRQRYRNLLSEIPGIALIFTLIFVWYSNEAQYWLYIFIIVASLLSLAQLLPSGKEHNQGEDHAK